MAPIAIAIDGPSGAGKSTIARALAQRFGYIYVDTGALYRAVGYTVLRRGLPIRDEAAVSALLPTLRLSFAHQNGEQRVFVNGEDVSDHIRTPDVSMAASAVSAQPAVRAFLFHLQQDIAAAENVIMDGRDIGTVVLPQAQVKIFLSASAEMRARRRYAELIEKGQSVSYEAVLADMKQRDYDDAHRAIAPLKAADDAVAVDTTNLTLEESIAHMAALIAEKLSQKGSETR